MKSFTTGPTRSQWIVTIFLCWLLMPGAGQSQAGRIKWEKDKLASGMKWQSAHTDKLFDSRQSINILRINPRKRKLALAHAVDTLLPLSTFGKNREALAAINAGFFNMQEGGSVTILKVDDKMVSSNNQMDNPEITSGAFVVTNKGVVKIEAAMPSEWYRTNPFYRDVIVTGPLLLLNGQVQQLSDRKFNDNRHPRSCACLTERGYLLLITIDGRNAEAQGMSLPELTKLLKSLYCREAVNLDGGGSTTLWIKGQPYEGVVNYPSDNKKFDHAGQRPVANAILVK